MEVKKENRMRLSPSPVWPDVMEADRQAYVTKGNPS